MVNKELEKRLKALESSVEVAIGANYSEDKDINKAYKDTLNEVKEYIKYIRKIDEEITSSCITEDVRFNIRTLEASVDAIRYCLGIFESY